MVDLGMVGKTKAMWLSVAITVLAASGGAAQQVEVMPDLSNPGVRQNFVSRLQERCGKGFAIELPPYEMTGSCK